MSTSTSLIIIVLVAVSSAHVLKQALSKVEGKVCKGGSVECPDKSTCCMLKSHNYGCCPFPNAVCCSDDEHCCPEGYKCGEKTCSNSLVSATMLKIAVTTPSPSITTKSNNLCPDEEHKCPSGQTCCQLGESSYGCCRSSNAVCCNDGKHCCPEGFYCDSDDPGKCLKAAGTTTKPNRPIQQLDPPKAVICSDNKSECPSNETCCLNQSKEYGCCPSANATCCADEIHCCPHGTECDLAGHTCRELSEADSHMVIPMLTKKPAGMLKTMICPDGKSECFSNNTCCLNKSKKYSCCPIANATCCDDEIHCCPHGTKCDLIGHTCHGRSEANSHVIIPMLTKNKPVITLKDSVLCPDGKSECSSEETCCKLSSGNYGCCPEINGVCCADGKHCCPDGSTCDETSGNCARRPIALLMSYYKQNKQL